MRCIDAIRNAIEALPDDAIFTSRDMCKYGFRNEVDQAMFKLVRTEYITRLAWGVFTKHGAPQPAAYEVAKIKAEAFGKKLVTHGADLADGFANLFEDDISGPAEDTAKASAESQVSKEDADKDLVFQVRGRTSSFKFGDRRIHLKGTTDKKIQGGESTTGRIKRSLWHLGLKASRLQLFLAINSLPNETLSDLVSHTSWMPFWLSDSIRSVLMFVRAAPVPAA